MAKMTPEVRESATITTRGLLVWHNHVTLTRMEPQIKSLNQLALKQMATTADKYAIMTPSTQQRRPVCHDDAKSATTTANHKLNCASKSSLLINSPRQLNNYNNQVRNADS